MIKAGFTRSDKKGDPTCRWKVDDIQFDVVPAKAAGTHSSNKWYFEATDASEEKKLSNGIKIRHLNSVYYIASKLEAFKNRGFLKDLMQLSYGGNDDIDNHDLEDVVLLLDSYNGFLSDLRYSKST